ncbi:MAG: DUF4340 domain-containing protein [Pirellulaceae bacterium]|nr:DUF4340 domain-containing protein [Pirellulaceae bacterium]
MSQMTKTLVFAGLAIVAAGLAFATRTGPVGIDQPEQIGKPLFDDFEDPLAANSMKIVRFDEDLSKLSEIEIKEIDGIWTLPSHAGYPADAENKIRDAATPFVDMKIIDVVTDKDGEHATYGVLEPGADKLAVGDQGVGTLVNIKDESGKNLVDLVIGKEYQEGQHYVRPVKHSRVYLAAVDPSTLPVRFDDWIEKDLLNVSAFDISGMTLKDYSFDVAQTLRGPITQFDRRFEMQVSDENGQWKLDSLLEARNDNLVPVELTEGQQLNQERLNAMKDALDNLEIVDVARKPAGLGEDLKADKGFFNNQSGVDSLIEKGVYPVQLDGSVELLSTDGEVLVDTKEGVQYVLRFGGAAGVDTESNDAGLNRYLLVSARVNENHFPEPDLETLPSEVPALPETQSAIEGSDEVEVELEIDETEGDTPPETPEENTVLDDEVEAVTTNPEGELEAADDSAVESEATNDEATNDEAGDTCQEEPDESADATSEATAEGEEGTAEEQLQAEQERIEKANQRMIDERNDRIKAAEGKVRELNYRFADWYYVISEDVYKKIHLSLSEIVQESDAANQAGGPGAGGIDALRSLQGGGLQLPPGLQPPGN